MKKLSISKMAALVVGLTACIIMGSCRSDKSNLKPNATQLEQGEDQPMNDSSQDKVYEQSSQEAATEQSSQAVAPDVELTTTEGKTVKLSSLTKGKFTYIDVWATWCHPCCQEIPFLEKLVERYKGNDKLQFLSISIDQNKADWLKKLETDKPQWQQFIIQGEAAAQFSDDWELTAIPRFIVIGPMGTIVSADATRPSDPATVSMIDGLINN